MSEKQLRGVWISGLIAVALLSAEFSLSQGAETVGAAKTVDTRHPSVKVDAKKQVDDLATRVFAITDLVLDQHPESPTRQEMILTGLRAALGAKHVTTRELGRRVSELRTKDDLVRLLNDLGPKLESDSEASNRKSEVALLQGLLRPVAGNASLIPAKEARVQAQLQANRYIGIGIALGLDDKTQMPLIRMVQTGGPAGLGGVRVGDLIEEINHVRVAPETPISETVDQLRGPEGSELTIRVRQANAKESRTLALVRLPVMFKSVKCAADKPDEDKVILLNTKPAIAYLKIDSIMASTARELASWEPRLREAGVQGLVLDLRGTAGATHGGFDSQHSALLVADALLDSKPLGALRSRDGVRKFTADRECLFRDLPLAVLIDANTNGPAEWVAAALQDAQPSKEKRRRAVIVGDHFVGPVDNYVRTAFPIPGSEDTLILATAAWERPTSVDAPRAGDAADESSEWRVRGDVAYDGSPAGSRAGAAKQQKETKHSKQVISSAMRDGDESPKDPKDQAAYDNFQKEMDRQYKATAVAAIRAQLELAAKASH